MFAELVLVSFANAVLWCLDILLDLLFHWTLTGGSKTERQAAADKYESSAQVVRIMWMCCPRIIRPTTLQSVLYRHERYVHPDFVLEHPNVTLLAVEKDHALFCMTDPNVNIYDCVKFPFMNMAQYTEPTKLIILPIRSFHKLANELGDPKVPVTMTAITTRCGSTLLVQIFNNVPGTRCLSEPYAMLNIHYLNNDGKLTEEENRNLLRSTVRLHCKVEPGTGVEMIFLKMCPANAPQFKDFSNLFPSFTFLFNTRLPVPSIKSLLLIVDLQSIGLFKVAYKLVMRQKMVSMYCKTFDFVSKRWSLQNLKQIDHAETAITVYATSMLAFFAKKEMFDKVVIYESLTEDPDQEILKIFDVVGIDHFHLPKAIEAMGRHSQKGSHLDREKLKPVKFDMDAEMCGLFDSYMQGMGMGGIRHDMPLNEFKDAFKTAGRKK
jgi:hypothetical protein